MILLVLCFFTILYAEGFDPLMETVKDFENLETILEENSNSSEVAEFRVTTEGWGNDITTTLDYYDGVDPENDTKIPWHILQGVKDPESEVNDSSNNSVGNSVPKPTEVMDRKYCAMELKGNIKGLIPPKLTFKITVIIAL